MLAGHGNVQMDYKPFFENQSCTNPTTSLSSKIKIEKFYKNLNKLAPDMLIVLIPDRTIFSIAFICYFRP